MIRRFNRYELKYFLPVHQCESIMADLKNFTQPDKHGGEAGYRVVSLYYDSPQLDFFWAKIEGIKFRRKVRIRIYPDTAEALDRQLLRRDRIEISLPEGSRRGIGDDYVAEDVVGVSDMPPRPGEARHRVPVCDVPAASEENRKTPIEPIEAVDQAMVEIKQRINRTVQKRRVQLPLEQAEQLCGGSLERDDLDLMDQQVVSEVKYLVNAMHLKPSCITAYRRVGFVGGHYNPGLRITFDTDLRYRVHALKVDQNAENHLLAPPEWCIMEVKANDAIPDWVTSLLARHGCQLRRISKYCAGLALAHNIAAMHLAFTPFQDKRE